MDMRNTLKTLCQAYGPTGNEGSVAQVIREMVAPVADEMTTDAMGNLIVTKKGRGQGRLMMAAHMDEIGLMVTYVEEDGFLRIDAVGGVRPQTTAFRQIRFENGVTGVVGYESAKVKNFAELHLFPAVCGYWRVQPRGSAGESFNRRYRALYQRLCGHGPACLF